ncbi:hypothetical protein JCGZ_22173 [Jatropha curcas]|uniref:Reverse transcriptase Ty1/copia-type domain-containing protein n=1 Tax=Jatropha curcas TaxID=180498 RepID=A0A067L803_JATCU|nr:hypothetical protein JCGZ_22173 [Jatropha curcas]
MGFKQSRADYSLFTKNSDSGFIALLMYVDDVTIASNNEQLVKVFKQELSSYFKLKDLGDLRYFLGLEVPRSKSGISVCQRKYTPELLEEYGQLGAKPCRTPIEVNYIMTHIEEGLIADPTEYRQLIGKLLYLTITRPDISYTVHVLAQFMDKQASVHMEAAHQVLR